MLSQFDLSASFQSAAPGLAVVVGNAADLLIGLRSPPPELIDAAADEVEIGMVEVVGVEVVDQRRSAVAHELIQPLAVEQVRSNRRRRAGRCSSCRPSRGRCRHRLPWASSVESKRSLVFISGKAETMTISADRLLAPAASIYEMPVALPSLFTFIR